jgi:hypothetical protein
MSQSDRSIPSSSEAKTEGTVSRSKSSPSNDADRLVSKARHYADLGDRWFVSVGRAIARSANKVSGEATFVADSAGKAADTTLHVGRELVGAMSSKVVTIRLPRPRFGGNSAPKATEGGVQALLHRVGALVNEHADKIEALSEDELETLVHQVCDRLEEDLHGLKEVPVERPSGEIVDSYLTSEEDESELPRSGNTEPPQGEAIADLRSEEAQEAQSEEAQTEVDDAEPELPPTTAIAPKKTRSSRKSRNEAAKAAEEEAIPSDEEDMSGERNESEPTEEEEG